MATNDRIDFLRSVPLFREVGKRDLERLADAAIERTFDPGASIVEEDTLGTTFMVIVDGEAEAVTVATGEETVVAALGSGDYFGELALFENERRSASVRAKTAVTCLVFTRWDFLAELRHTPDLAVQMLIATMRRLRATTGELAAARGEDGPTVE